MSFNPQPIQPDVELIDLIRRVNEIHRELAQFLEERQVDRRFEPPLAPFLGMQMYANFDTWSPDYGRGFYGYGENGLWYKLGARALPNPGVLNNVSSNYTVVAGDITDPITVVRAFLASGPITITCTLTGSEGDKIGFQNSGVAPMTINYGGSKQIVLQVGDLAGLNYSTVFGWLPL